MDSPAPATGSPAGSYHGLIVLHVILVGDKQGQAVSDLADHRVVVSGCSGSFIWLSYRESIVSRETFSTGDRILGCLAGRLDIEYGRTTVSQRIFQLGMTNDLPPICDYEGSNYRTRFWESQGRSYEDRVERIALRRLMPAAGGTLIDIGAGYGRLAPEFDGYRRIVLFDYSRSLLEEARQQLGADSRFVFVTGNWYRMPFVPGLFDTLVQVRTIHHAADVPALFAQLARIARPNGDYILEYANKHNLKAILRYWLGRQEWSPFSPQPVEFVELNFDFHPRWVEDQLAASGFKPGRKLTVSHFRLPLLKRLVPTGVLAGLDSLIQASGDWWQLAPSVFVHSHSADEGPAAEPGEFFACPDCLTPMGETVDEILTCGGEGCGRRWSAAGGIYDFKTPID